MTTIQFIELRKLIVAYGEAKVDFSFIDTEADPNYRTALDALDKTEKDIEVYMGQFIKD